MSGITCNRDVAQRIERPFRYELHSCLLANLGDTLLHGEDCVCIAHSSIGETNREI